jgi:hypothetical protein
VALLRVSQCDASAVNPKCNLKVAVFSTKPYDRQFLDAANGTASTQHELVCFDTQLEPKTAGLAAGCLAVCVLTQQSITWSIAE